MNIYELPASEIVRKIAFKELTSGQVAEAFINRILTVNPKLNAIHQVDPERILKEADRADAVILAGEPLGKLHGLPITIKDTCEIAGFKVSKGYNPLTKLSTQNATVVSRLKAEGAIILGITNVPELLMAYETDNRTHGRTNNPYDLSRTPGGSSGGEAAILAAGGSPLGLGSDAGGSVRQPAHYAGICAHKPTQGFVPLTGDTPFDGEAGLITSVLALGPMARHVEDLALAMEVIAGADGLDPYVPPIKFTRLAHLDLSKLKVAYYFENQLAPPSEEIKQAVLHAVEALAAEGANITHDYPKLMDKVYDLHWETIMLGGDKGENIKAFFTSCDDQGLNPLLKKSLSQLESCNIPTAELRQRWVEIEKYKFDLMRWMVNHNYDVVISPVASTTARKHGETFDNLYDFEYVRAHNLSGWPATVVPIGLSKEGLPIAVQVAAKPWQDHLALAVAQALQEKFGVLSIPIIK